MLKNQKGEVTLREEWVKDINWDTSKAKYKWPIHNKKLFSNLLVKEMQIKAMAILNYWIGIVLKLIISKTKSIKFMKDRVSNCRKTWGD